MILNEKLVEILDKVCEKMGIFIDWSAEQVTNNLIPYLTQLSERIITYEISMSVFEGIFCFLLCFLSVKVDLFLCKKFKQSIEDEDYMETLWGLGIAIISIVIFVCFNCGIEEIEDIIQALTLPELTIIEFMKPYMDTIK